MKLTQALLVPAAVLAFAFASLATVERTTTSAGTTYTLSARNDADALFCCRRFVRAIGGAVRSVGNTVRRAASDVGRGVSNVARNVGNTVRRVATNVGNTVKKGVETVKKTVSNVANAVVKGVKGVADLAKKGLKAVGDAVKKGLMALKDLLSWVWDTMKNKLLKPVGDFFKNAIEKGKAALKKLVDKALAALQGVFMDNVIAPAMKWAFQKLFPAGSKTAQKIKEIAERVIGQVDKIAGQAEAFADTMEAFASKNLAKYDAALAKFDGALNKWANVTLTDLAQGVVSWAKDKVEEFVKGKTIELLGKAYKLVETPINMGKTAALSAISSIPFAGGAIAGAADIVITTGLGLLREKGFEFIGTKAAELAGKAVTWLGTYIVRGAAAIDAKLRPILTPIMAVVKPLVAKAVGMVKTVKDKWTMLRGKLKQARGVLAKAQAAVK